jgi:hypothetical protein
MSVCGVLFLRRSLALAALVSGAACDATANLGYDDRPLDGGADASPGPTLLPSTPPPTAPDGPIEEMKARCADPAHGPVDAYGDYATFEKKVVGRWFSCAPGQPLVADLAGIEFHADHTWNFVREDSGKLVAQRGLGNEGAWSEKYTGFVGYFQIDVAGSPEASDSLFFGFEVSPHRMRMTLQDSPTGQGWYVTAAAQDTTVLP